MFGAKAWFDAMRFAAEVQTVIGLRMLRLAAGGPLASREAARMVAEKAAATAEAQAAAFLALATGAPPAAAAARAQTRYRRTVRANKRRLRR